MPCACKKPVEKYPENVAWGPLFWRLLHGLAELAGKQAFSTLQNDECRIWAHLLTSLCATLPCDDCRTHCGEWLKTHPVAPLATIPYSEVGTFLRTWLWSLHNAVNERTHKAVFPYEQLATTYKGTQITATWKQLENVIQVAISLNGLTLKPWKTWLGLVRQLQGIYGV